MCVRFFVLTVAATLVFVGQGLSAEPPAPAAELKRLEPFVGTWKVADFVSKKAEWTPKEVRASGDVATTKWIMDGCFLEDRKVPSNGSEHLGIWSYDQAEKAFRYTMFQAPQGNRSGFIVRWNEKTQAFDGTFAMPDGITMHTRTRFPDDKTKEWQAKAIDGSGKVFLDTTCKETRFSALGKDQAIQVLRDFLAAAKAADSKKAAEVAHLPAFDANTPAGLDKILPRLASPKVLSSDGIDGLAKGEWGLLSAVFPEGHVVRNNASSLLRLPPEACFGLRNGTAFAAFYWDGKQLRLIDLKNAGD